MRNLWGNANEYILAVHKYMKKRSKKRKEPNMGICNMPYISENRLVEIQTEAFYRALKRIKEDEEEKKENNDSGVDKNKKFEDLLFFCNVTFFPFKISKRFQINQRIYDSILVLIVSWILKAIGVLIWVGGVFTVIYDVVRIVNDSLAYGHIVGIVIGIVLMIFGSLFIQGGRGFSKESDSNKIYAYSASILALVSCVIGVIALFKGSF